MMMMMMNIQDATVCSLEKWTLKFKLLYLLNHIGYFNKTCRICGPSSVNAVNLVKKSATIQEISNFS